MYSGWMGDDDASFLGLRACAHKVSVCSVQVDVCVALFNE
jgi:hypothetical protein